MEALRGFSATRPRNIRARSGRPPQACADPLRQAVRGRPRRRASCRTSIMRRARMIQRCSRIWQRSALSNRSWWRRRCSDGWPATTACSAIEATRQRVRRFRAGADRRPCPCGRARRCGDRVRSFPAGVAARRPVDLAAQPEPRTCRAGCTGAGRGAPARRHAGAAAADHGRPDRSALLRRHAGPARIFRAACGDVAGRGFLRGVS